MTGAGRALFTVAAGAWIVALGTGGIAIRTLVRRRGRDTAWKRLPAGSDCTKWEDEWRSRRRVAGGTRSGTLVAAAGARALGLAC